MKQGGGEIISTGTGSYQLKWMIIVVITCFTIEQKKHKFNEKIPAFSFSCFTSFFGQITKQSQFLGGIPQLGSRKQKILSIPKDVGYNLDFLFRKETRNLYWNRIFSDKMEDSYGDYVFIFSFAKKKREKSDVFLLLLRIIFE